MTEFAKSGDQVRDRTGAAQVTELVPWTRTVGGRFGFPLRVPAGTYSDDTQLRLATSRSIAGPGKFDVEAFAKVELPVWLGYAMGGGRGTKAAANSLAKSNSTWATNFFRGKESTYFQSGGNGAAMRIQPHVWSAKDDAEISMVSDVIRNAVSTHGDPVGITGAVFHALSLRACLCREAVPEPSTWLTFLEDPDLIADLIGQDDELALAWLPNWHAQNEISLKAALNQTIKASQEMLDRALNELANPMATGYAQLIEVLDARNPKVRGAGTTTAIMALAVAWWGRKDPQAATITAANALGTDTDTISSMAGALLGAACAVGPPQEPQDSDYLIEDAERLFAISKGSTSRFPYPDLLHWDPPKSQADTLRLGAGGHVVVGLGPAVAASELFRRSVKDEYGWQWNRLWYGQTILSKRRQSLRQYRTQGGLIDPGWRTDSDPSNLMRRDHAKGPDRIAYGQQTLIPAQLPVEDRPTDGLKDRMESSDVPPKSKRMHFGHPDKLTLTRAMTIVSARNFSPVIVGQLLIQFAEDSEDGLGKASAFAALVARELRERTALKKRSTP